MAPWLTRSKPYAWAPVISCSTPCTTRKCCRTPCVERWIAHFATAPDDEHSGAVNAALHRIAVTQIRLDGLGRTYYRHRLDHGDSTPEALRCLKRRLARVVYNHLHTDHNNRQKPCQPAAA